MRRSRARAAGAALVGMALAGMAMAGAAPARAEVPFYGYEIVNAYPHDENAYTQGLYIEDGDFYESTGQYGASSLRRVDIETGEVLEQIDLPEQYFGEGIVGWGEEIVLLTWRAGVGFVFSREGFRKIRQFTYEGEGWGLTHDGTRIIMSNGAHVLRYLDPETLEPVARLPVTFRGRPLPRLNELEWVDGLIYANVYGAEQIVQIDPKTGAVVGLIDLSGILPDEERRPGRTDVLNGIAYDPETERLFVTGKNWPKVYEIKVTPAIGTQ